MDNDGYTDVVIAAANGFSGVDHENRLLYNNGDGSFTHIFSTAVTESLDAHTIPTFSDFDQDGDLDLFIGSGEVTQLTPDNLFRNTLVENGSWGFDRITTAPIATDLVDGQVWNWIDYDNDGDLDAFQTNYTFAATNNLYRNDGGTYVRMTDGDVGTIVSDPGSALGNVWGDFDNDGDVDCLVTNDGAFGTNDYFRNDGGVFAQDLLSLIVTEAGAHYGSPIADYDEDGDLDVYVNGGSGANRLWENQLANGYAWIELELVGSGAPGSNVSAIGARVRALATIDGTPTWQLREVSSQNSFNSMSMLRVHFGLRDAAVIDSLVVEWPAGDVDVLTAVAPGQLLIIGETAPATSVRGPGLGTVPLELRQNVPNPFGHATRIDFDLASATRVRLEIYDVAGRHVRTLLDALRPAGRHDVSWNGRDAAGQRAAAGVYLCRMTARNAARDSGAVTRRMVLLPQR